MDYDSKTTFGSLSSAPDGSIVEHIFTYVAGELKSFEGKSNENENVLTDRLCKQLSANQPSETPYFFHHQNLEKSQENTSTDFAVFQRKGGHYQDNELPKFEAKRLTTNFPSKRKKEYVIGEYNGDKRITNAGAIERFKNGRHGADVDIAGIIGYVQADTFSNWHKNINEWIDQEIQSSHDPSLTWSITDKLISEYIDDQVAVFRSESSRKSGTDIRFRHLWVDVSTSV